ncbi:PstS family phosphate ABC transporter substrate-binding protein [Gracilibacillus caseinilyticus]|uniref:Phosphate-binding protein n=1 Tax=Gracilibacillus caseinilyticus TaxID=2932256 RepID=A0ABY4EZ46_9BACI|nr:PstS family phosphate ABC transporter substrate-binding protein [Gracilibacillus caseinilyticus]UOQ47441.1 PstS family phosphate ABC transporter substrate-binding protein [Gracilibacillus caseinilyticus]
MNKWKLMMLVAIAVLTMGVLAACGNSPAEDEEGTGEETTNEASANEGSDNAEESSDSEEVSGPVNLDGSSTVLPIMEYLTYEYNQVQPNVETALNSSGSGGGFKKSTVGEIDFSNASRPIKDEERATAEENGIELLELELAYDGLSVVVSQENDFVENLTVDQLKEIFLADGSATKWSDLNPEWPEEDIIIYSPGHDSGTFDYFNEVILEENPMREGENTTLSEDDNTLVTGIKNDPYAIGYFGYAYYLENQDSLKVLGIDNGDGNPVKPDGDTIQDGSYSPLSRPLFTYVNVDYMKEKPQVFDFAKYALENAGAAAEEVGYVALPDEKYQEQIDKITEMVSE